MSMYDYKYNDNNEYDYGSGDGYRDPYKDRDERDCTGDVGAILDRPGKVGCGDLCRAGKKLSGTLMNKLGMDATAFGVSSFLVVLLMVLAFFYWWKTSPSKDFLSTTFPLVSKLFSFLPFIKPSDPDGASGATGSQSNTRNRSTNAQQRQELSEILDELVDSILATRDTNSTAGQMHNCSCFHTQITPRGQSPRPRREDMRSPSRSRQRYDE